MFPHLVYLLFFMILEFVDSSTVTYHRGTTARHITVERREEENRNEKVHLMAYLCALLHIGVYDSLGFVPHSFLFSFFSLLVLSVVFFCHLCLVLFLLFLHATSHDS